MKILVTGGAGFIGSAVVRQAVGAGHEVVNLDALTYAATPEALEDKVEQVVRLIRSKGVGVYFVTQNPIDIPEKIAGQLGNRVQHALRAFTPRDKRAIKAAGSPYLVFLGGMGSLHVESGEQVLDDPRWPAWYLETASPAYLRRAKTIYEGKVIPFVIPPERCLDVDNPIDWKIVEFLMKDRLGIA